MEPPDAAPAASVVVPTHRGAHRLPLLLDALAAQRVEQPWEVVVVVDGPDAATDAVLAVAPRGLPLVVVHRPASTGVAAALNAGTEAARGRVVIRCDDDLTPAPDMVARHLAHHAGDERVGIIGPTRDVLPDSRYARAYGRRATQRSVTAVLAAPEDRRWRHWAAHTSVRRDVLEAVGGYDTAFSYREDSELGLRLARAGVRLLVDPALVLPHRGAPADARTRVARAWVSGASEVLFAQRHPDVEPPAAPPVVGAAARAWSGATAALAGLLPTHGSARRLGSVVDTLLRVLPAGVGGRVVALAVEAAARAGRRHGLPEQRSYRSQKDAELEGEARRAAARDKGRQR
ncbi:glycosyltransferase [Phycicoccus sonneratiae]|uniref:Glycosyltransferase family 2 protein n=1 Tax=Phycicoccus sonneratiae TaxID=2807628 RepID=A0ABS2CGX2_9MICO|nr:glycosyltransferase [Phycicoccus sonneraticus]MBM6399117.1 glycosyltransferase family 2 protein [Phycicoccus sonneraticus]